MSVRRNIEKAESLALIHPASAETDVATLYTKISRLRPQDRARLEALQQIVGRGLAPSSITSLSPNFGAAAGGTAVTIHGTNFRGSPSVTFGGVAATSVVVVNRTTITCVAPALASGSINDVKVGGATIVNGWLAFTPADLALSGWWSADFAGAPWAPSASAGGSGGTGNAIAHIGVVTPGTAVNGHTPAHFSASDLTNATDATTFFTVGSGSIIAIVKPNTASVPTGNFFDDPCVYRDSNADVVLSYTTLGFGAITFQAAYKTVYEAAPSAVGAYHLVRMRWDSANLGLTVDSNPERTTACGALTIMTGTLEFAVGNAGGFLGMDLLDIMMLPTSLSDANYAKIKNYALFRYGLVL